MTKPEGLRELEKRLLSEPDNLGLRVAVAGAMCEAGRQADAVELYRSVAVVYRDQGRTQQALAVCRSILEIAPDDVRCHALVASLVAGHKGRAQHDTAQLIGARSVEIEPVRKPEPQPVRSEPQVESEPFRRSSYDETPLPRPLPYHVADPTTRSLKKLSEADLPAAEGVETRPGSDDGTRPEVGGMASAARRISAQLIAATDEESGYETLDLTAELETRQRRRIESSELKKISLPPPTAPVERVDFDDAVTPPPRDSEASGVPSRDHDTEEELTVPREMPLEADAKGVLRTPLANLPGHGTTGALLSSAFFAPLPAVRRGAVLGRFQRKLVAAGSTVIRQGEGEHPLVIVARGRLEVRAERADGQIVPVTSVGSGEYIGEVGLLGRLPSAVHVIATLDGEVLVLPPRDFYEIVGAFPALWAELKDVAERRSRELAAKLRR